VAEEATHRVAGVLDVANEIQVRGPDRPAWSGTETAQSASSLDAPEQSDPYQDQGAPEQIRRSVEEALGQRAERQPHLIRRESEEILVEVRDGQALLSGELGTWDEKEAALGAAGQAPGVSGVEDHLVIRHSL
jgi:osmotically-inducible protein OsmY